MLRRPGSVERPPDIRCKPRRIYSLSLEVAEMYCTQVFGTVGWISQSCTPTPRYLLFIRLLLLPCSRGHQHARRSLSPARNAVGTSRPAFAANVICGLESHRVVPRDGGIALDYPAAPNSSSVIQPIRRLSNRSGCVNLTRFTLPTVTDPRRPGHNFAPSTPARVASPQTAPLAYLTREAAASRPRWCSAVS